MSVSNVNNPNYVPQYATFRGETVRNSGGLTQQVILERKLGLEVNNRIDPSGRMMQMHFNQINALIASGRSGVNPNTPTPAWEAMNNRRIEIIRELMSEQEEGSLKMDILQRMLERAQSPNTGGIRNVRYAERPGMQSNSSGNNGLNINNNGVDETV